ncbi:hypothetical protein TRICHSKD4_2301 [Roseibium sp. TrichSKD4]|nr:hypothetical protein [Roseibium sp. TrichSKD4]EFO32502.1 hypothetical protein TRICHSKD4_2301 [Roseibium sp. TrichSKD4]
MNRGWSSDWLDQLPEVEFLVIYEQQIAFDEARAEAKRKAYEKAGR